MLHILSQELAGEEHMEEIVFSLKSFISPVDNF
jgi:hypothetical protein